MVGEGVLRQVKAKAVVPFARGSEVVVRTVLGIGVIGIVMVAVGLVCIIVIIIVVLKLANFRRVLHGRMLVASASISVLNAIAPASIKRTCIHKAYVSD